MVSGEQFFRDKQGLKRIMTGIANLAQPKFFHYFLDSASREKFWETLFPPECEDLCVQRIGNARSIHFDKQNSQHSSAACRLIPLLYDYLSDNTE